MERDGEVQIPHRSFVLLPGRAAGTLGLGAELPRERRAGVRPRPAGRSTRKPAAMHCHAAAGPGPAEL